ncbi:MAG: polysaccharide deacetylase family protein [Candidatus Binatia bacterium]
MNRVDGSSAASRIQKLWWSVKALAKEAIRWSLYWSGTSFVYSRLIGGTKTIVLVYHTAGDGEIAAYPNSVIDEAEFRRQMSHLGRLKTVVPLAECVRRFRRREPQVRASVALTFDDGYKACLDTVAPILREHGFPATFFVVPGIIDRGEGKWDDVLYFTMRPFRKAALRAGVEEITKLMRELERSDGPRVCERKRASAAALLTWPEVKALRAIGHSIQSHSMNHYYLSAQSLELQEHEMAKSKRRLEEVLGEPIELLAYPFGWDGSYTNETKALAKRAGYAAAFVCDQGYLEDSDDEFALKRMGVSADTPLWKFKLMLSGLFF